tara:strand:+ start:659 stop:847 length:189 start_codon:yes stop_codon:yes gene_type:complete
MKMRAVNYTSTDEDGNKIYTSHTIQIQRGDGVWVNIPVTEIYVEPEEPRLMIVDPPNKRSRP